MVVVNLFGAPGAGKSTGAAYIFAKLKMAGYNAEYVPEFAKDKTWEENDAVFKNQLYIFGKQSFRISRLNDKVDVVVTDGPILNSAFYNNARSDAFNAVVRREFGRYDNINIFFNRCKPYNPKGRFQSEMESDAMSARIRDFLTLEMDIPYFVIDGNEPGYDSAINIIKHHINQANNTRSIS